MRTPLRGEFDLGEPLPTTEAEAEDEAEPEAEADWTPTRNRLPRKVGEGGAEEPGVEGALKDPSEDRAEGGYRPVLSDISLFLRMVPGPPTPFLCSPRLQ
jgi:hypothetical protein